MSRHFGIACAIYSNSRFATAVLVPSRQRNSLGVFLQPIVQPSYLDDEKGGPVRGSARLPEPPETRQLSYQKS